ncbi:psbP domain-containing protein 5, chloroplastic isoform X3 [Gossypium australe]|uniref:PsbP domain-containing protein 5, chloroplastic isoform X3 n=1 Tax=Gossypium australe TaxID=47621 RepID=A0A5B6WHC0_9ROSI|nr:psbP domain-containing protein 5, chloroplastic isoform X3 [Gossypium australe]
MLQCCFKTHFPKRFMEKGFAALGFFFSTLHTFSIFRYMFIPSLPLSLVHLVHDEMTLIAGCLAAEDVTMTSLVDEINAYTYSYPVELPSKKFLFKWVESRKPECYSSAAPLSRPSNVQFLKSKDKKTWAAKDVADSVLSDKSALVIHDFFLFMCMIDNLHFLTSVHSRENLS